ncbi:MAG: phosphoglucosamine mutase [Verrucomicrobiota bacterium]
MAKRELFGTDGIRGKAGVYPLDAATALQLGRASAAALLSSDEKALVVIGKDTRASGDMLEQAMAAGLNAEGVDVLLAGVIPTPAVALLTRKYDAAFGVVISASHNPFHDNGIKFFGPDGFKLPDEVELAMEDRLLGRTALTDEVPEIAGRTTTLATAMDEYVDFVCGDLSTDLLSGLKVALDTANGASYVTSEKILRRLGADVTVYHADPDGVNINANCGCTHSEIIEELVKTTDAQIGVSHDGDADRVLLCDENGSVVDGDEIMAIAGKHMIENGTLAHNTVVATVMSNAGLEIAMKEAGGQVVRTGVGDRYVVEEMRKGGYNLGGEQSGHFIFMDHNTTGDGIVSALQLLKVVKETGKPLSELRQVLTKLPQVLINLAVSDKPEPEEVPAIKAAMDDVRGDLGEFGRILIRYSGTEPLIRILVEGPDEAVTQSSADRLAEVIKAEIGA